MKTIASSLILVCLAALTGLHLIHLVGRVSLELAREARRNVEALKELAGEFRDEIRRWRQSQ
jgi:hypothetical protein